MSRNATNNIQTDQVGQGRRNPPGRRADAWLWLATCVSLILFGVMQAVLGTFFYGAGPAPLASIGFDLAIAATCLLGAWGLRRPFGGVAPAVGWLIIVFVLASGTSGGSVLITASMAGEWFLFGGAACATAAMLAALTIWPRHGLGQSFRYSLGRSRRPRS